MTLISLLKVIQRKKIKKLQEYIVLSQKEEGPLITWP